MKYWVFIHNCIITDFVVLQQIEGKDKIFIPKVQYGNHYHNFDKNIIYQIEPSDLLYHNPG